MSHIKPATPLPWNIATVDSPKEWRGLKGLYGETVIGELNHVECAFQDEEEVTPINLGFGEGKIRRNKSVYKPTELGLRQLEIREQNALYIKTACNLFPELVEAVEELLNRLTHLDKNDEVLKEEFEAWNKLLTKCKGGE